MVGTSRRMTSQVNPLPHLFHEQRNVTRADTALLSFQAHRRCSKAMKKSLLATLALMFVSFGASVHAADGPYVGIGGNFSILNDPNVTAPAREPYRTVPLNVNATTDKGFAVRGMAGYAFPSGLRVEAEIDYRRNRTRSMDVKSPGAFVELAAPGVAQAANAKAGSTVYADPAKTSYADLESEPRRNQQVSDQQTAYNAASGTKRINGNFSMLSFMANVNYDFDTGSRWKPYVGSGLGFASISLDAESADGRSLVDDDDIVFAYQVGAGIGYEFALPEGRSLTVSLDWRYFGTQSPTFKGELTGGDFEAEINGHDIGIGLRYWF